MTIAFSASTAPSRIRVTDATIRYMDADAYLRAVEDGLLRGGYRVTSPPVLGGSALVGYRSDFRLSWVATKLHLFVAVKAVPAVSRASLNAFTADVLDYGKQTKGRLRGLQVGVGAIAALVSSTVDPAARDTARRDLRRQYSAFAWPVVVDLGVGDVVSHEGNPRVGAIYNRWMRSQIAATLELPADR